MKKALQDLEERIFYSWETTLAAALCLVFLVIYWNDIDSLLKALGAIGIITGFFVKHRKK